MPTLATMKLSRRWGTQIGDHLLVGFAVFVVAEFALDMAPDVGAGFQSGLEEEAGLVGDVFEVADEGGAVGAGGEVGAEFGLLADVSGFAGEHVWQLFLEFGTGQNFRGGFSHFAIPSLATTVSRNMSRNFKRALCS